MQRYSLSEERSGRARTRTDACRSLPLRLVREPTELASSRRHAETSALSPHRCSRSSIVGHDLTIEVPERTIAMHDLTIDVHERTIVMHERTIAMHVFINEIHDLNDDVHERAIAMHVFIDGIHDLNDDVSDEAHALSAWRTQS